MRFSTAPSFAHRRSVSSSVGNQYALVSKGLRFAESRFHSDFGVRGGWVGWCVSEARGSLCHHRRDGMLKPLELRTTSWMRPGKTSAGIAESVLLSKGMKLGEARVLQAVQACAHVVLGRAESLCHLGRVYQASFRQHPQDCLVEVGQFHRDPPYLNVRFTRSPTGFAVFGSHTFE